MKKNNNFLGSGSIKYVNCSDPNHNNNSLEYVKVLMPFASLVATCLAYKWKTDYKAEKDKSVYQNKCEMDIKKAQAIHDIRTQSNDADSQNSTQEEEEPKWENFNDAVYGHTNDKHQWLVGNVINMGGTHLIVGAKSIGKTIFVTTLANAISKGTEYRLFVCDNTNPCYQPPQQVFLYDLEMQYSDLNKRNGKHGYSFSNITRCDHSSFTVDSWLKNVKKVIDGLTCNATVILDNITRLGSDISQPTVGKKLFDGIKALKNAAKMKDVIVTFLLIAHTTNNRNDYDPITLRDAACADTMTTGMDSISMLGATKDTGKMFYKACCVRHAPTPVGVVTILELKEKPFMRFEIVGTDMETNVLPIKRSPAKAERINKLEDNTSDPEIRKGWPLSKAMEVEEASKTGSQRKVAELYGVSPVTIGNVLKDLKKYREMNQQEPSKE